LGQKYKFAPPRKTEMAPAQSNFLTFDQLTLEYLEFGTGSEIALSFHGFGRHAEDFRIFQNIQGNRFKFYSFNLFHHGGSSAPTADQPLNKQEWAKVFNAWIEEQGWQKVHLFGYSLGGKVVLSLYEMLPNRVAGLWLFAPDGIKKNFWYQLVAETKYGGDLYKFAIDHPEFMLSMISSLHRVGLIKKSTRKFVLNNLSEREKRQQVYDVWNTFKKVNPDIPKIIRILHANRTSLQQFYGQHDRIIKPVLGKWFGEKIGQSEHVHILDEGHLLLTPETAGYVDGIKE
jgi:pimeloyl-ACP methyl ester carboxylesterase